MSRRRHRSNAAPTPTASAEITALGQTVAVLWGQLAATRQQLSDAISESASLRTLVTSLRDELTATGAANTAALAASGSIRAGDVMDAQRLLLWAAHQPLNQCPLVSVVLPTAFPERAASFRGAVESVLEQSYRNWELIVVDNGAEPAVDPAPDWWPDDPRLRVVRRPVQHAGAARNVGLDVATGELIAYLDDDCRWFPWWLHAAVAAMADDELRFVHGIRFSGRPDPAPSLVQATEVTSIGLHLGNMVDTNVLVHRADLGVRWDEQLASCLDYDVMVQLTTPDGPARASRSTAEGEPARAGRLVLAPACTYGLDSPRRQWARENVTVNGAPHAEVQRRARRRRPLRVLAFNALYPLLSETYIGDELEALRRAGVDVALARAFIGPAACPSRVDAMLYDSLQAGIASFDPDLVLAHWAQVAFGVRQLTTPLGIPHAIRMHSFCAPAETGSLFDDHCIGAWELPSTHRAHPLVRRLPTMILGPGPMGDDGARSRTALSVSAGLPKKGFEVLAAAAATLDEAGIDTAVIIGLTRGYESIFDDIRAYFESHDLPVRLSINVPFDDVQAAMRRAGAMVYSLRAGVPTGQPRTVIEGALAGAPLVVPDTESLRSLVGDVAHFYVAGDAVSMAAATRAAIDHPHPWRLRAALADRIREEHSRPELGELWARDLTDAFVRWSEQRRHGRLDTARRLWSG